MIGAICLSKARPLEHWRHSKPGALILISLLGRPTIGVRCDLGVGESSVRGLLAISGDYAGKLIDYPDDADAASMPFSNSGLDVSEVYSLAVVNPIIYYPQNIQLKSGMLFADSGRYIAYFEMLSGESKGFVHIGNWENYADRSIGVIVEDMPTAWTVGIGTVGLRER